jgi:hypothetical protein
MDSIIVHMILWRQTELPNVFTILNPNLFTLSLKRSDKRGMYLEFHSSVMSVNTAMVNTLGMAHEK